MPSTGPFTWVGQWLGSPLSITVYYTNDVVTYGNIVYICTAAVSVLPGSPSPAIDTSNWEVMVTGSVGSSGSSGSSGTSGTGGTGGGTSGTSGESGTSGTSGSSGTSGESGTSGTSGS